MREPSPAHKDGGGTETLRNPSGCLMSSLIRSPRDVNSCSACAQMHRTSWRFPPRSTHEEGLKP
jgi:hypothetical protein